MLLKLLFWSLVACDLLAIGLWALLGLAAAAPSRTSPAAVVLLLLALPGALLGGAILLFLRAPQPWLRLLALAVVAAPVAYLAIGALVAQGTARANPGGRWGETALTRALREAAADPAALDRARALLAAGADANEAGEVLPLVQALRLAGPRGDEALRLLLDAGADPNRRDEFGAPAFFQATGARTPLDRLQLLLDRGASPQATGRDGRSAVWSAVATRNWAAALLLVERGAPVAGRSPMGRSLLETLEGEVRDLGPGAVPEQLLAAVRARG